MEQLKLPFPKVDRGVSFLRGGASRYAARNRRTYSAEGLDEIQAKPAYQHAIGRAYEDAPSGVDPSMAGSYHALKQETHDQFDYLTRPRTGGGLGLNVEFQDDDPYDGPESLIQDVQQNRRLRVLKSSSTGGAPHAFLDEETNDRFRAVHDAFGHAAIGRSFSRHGEEAAYHSHAQMYSEDARKALTSETRAQNSAMNFGAERKPGEFVEQKAARLPDWAMNFGADRNMPEPTTPRPLIAPRQFKLPGVD